MAFSLNKLRQPQIKYSPGNTVEFALPEGNLFSAINMLLKGKITVVTANASAVPFFQVLNLIEKLELIKDTNTIWTLDGRMFGVIMSARKGAKAPSNAAASGTVGVGNAFQHYLSALISDDDLAKPWDMLIDTRAHRYFLRITWKDVKTTGVLFGTNAANVSVAVNDDIYIETELERLSLRMLPNGQQDQYAGSAPLMRGLYQTPYVVTQSTQISIDFPVDKIVRGIHLMTVEESGNVEVARNTVFTGNVSIEDTNNVVHANRRAEVVREETLQELGVGNDSTFDGYYHLGLCRFGSVFDALKDEPTSRLKLKLDVTKLGGNTKVYAVFDTIERQGV